MDVRIGFFSFTEVTDPGGHRAYNAWHQLDHMPEQYSIPGVAHGQRWVATPACRAARAVEDPTFARVHYVTLYLMGVPVPATLEAFGALAEDLRESGRFFEHRRAHLSGPLEITGSVAAARVQVSAAVVPLRPGRGVYVVVEDGASGLPAPALLPLAAVPGVAGVWTFTATAELGDTGWSPGDRRVTVCYLDEAPLDVAPRLDELVHPPRTPFSERVVFAGPFETITPWQWDWFDDPDR